MSLSLDCHWSDPSAWLFVDQQLITTGSPPQFNCDQLSKQAIASPNCHHNCYSFIWMDACISFNQYVTPTNKTTHANFANHPTTRMRIAQFLCPSSLRPKIRISRSEILDFQREGSISSLVLDRCYLKVKIWKFVGCIAMHHSAKKCSLSTFSANNSHA